MKDEVQLQCVDELIKCLLTTDSEDEIHAIFDRYYERYDRSDSSDAVKEWLILYCKGPRGSKRPLCCKGPKGPRGSRGCD